MWVCMCVYCYVCDCVCLFVCVCVITINFYKSLIERYFIFELIIIYRFILESKLYM